MKLSDRIQMDLDEIGGLLHKVQADNLAEICRRISHAPTVFVVGQGRTGLVMKMFAMRLVQMGLTAHVVGDATTPAIQSADVLIAASGSGYTESVVRLTARANELGADRIVITSDPGSPLAGLASCLLIIPGKSLKTQKDAPTRLLLGTALEQSLLILLDSLALVLAEALGEDNSSMMRRHSNLE